MSSSVKWGDEPDVGVRPVSLDVRDTPSGMQAGGARAKVVICPAGTRRKGGVLYKYEPECTLLAGKTVVG